MALRAGLVDVGVFGQMLDSMILKVFSTFNDSVILRTVQVGRQTHYKPAPSLIVKAHCSVDSRRNPQCLDSILVGLLLF